MKAAKLKVDLHIYGVINFYLVNIVTEDAVHKRSAPEVSGEQQISET